MDHGAMVGMLGVRNPTFTNYFLDFGNFAKSLQKERTANLSEILSRIHYSKLQTEPRGAKHFF